jgi:Glycosyltransferase
MTKTDVILIRNANQFDFGGAEKYQILLAQELAQNDLRAIIVSGHQQLLNSAKQSNLPTVKSPWLKHQNFAGWRIVLTPLYFLWQIHLYCFYRRLFKVHQPQIVHIHSRDDFIAGTLAAHHLGIKVFWTDHADLKHILQNTQVHFKNPIGKTILKLTSKIDHLILISKSEKRAISQHIKNTHPFWQKTIIIPNGVNDIISTNKHPTHHQQTQSCFTFATSSRLVKDKGIAEAITAFNFVHKNHANCQLLIIGDGPDNQKFKKLAQGNTHIHFLGYLNQPLDTLQSVDCFLMPTYHEGLSLSLIEACMLQLPIITTNVGGNPEIITDQHNGLLIPPRDAEALEQAMLKIINHPDLARQLASQARQTFEQKFNFTKIVHNQILPLYFSEDDTIKS